MKWFGSFGGQHGPRWGESGAVAVALYALAALIAAGSLLWTTVDTVRAVMAQAPADAWLQPAARLLQGWALAAVLWAAGWWVRTGHRRAPADRPVRQAAPAELVDVLERMLHELEQLHTDVLLPPAQRPERLAQMRRQRTEAQAQRVRLAIDKAAFGEAQAAVNELRGELGDAPEVRRLQRELSAAREAAQDYELQRATDEVESLLEIGSYDQAAERAREFLAERPDSAAARGLVERVESARQARQAGDVQELYREVEQLAEQRRWRDALIAAQRLLEAYPDAPEARLVSSSAPTLEANARLEEVRETRDRIRQLLQHRRYSEALALARDVVERFPETAAAGELREQLDRLERLSESSQRQEAR